MIDHSDSPTRRAMRSAAGTPAYEALKARAKAEEAMGALTSEAQAEALKEARGWIADCSWAEGDPGKLNDAEVMRGIARHYEGGWAAFLADGVAV